MTDANRKAHGAALEEAARLFAKSFDFCQAKNIGVTAARRCSDRPGSHMFLTTEIPDASKPRTQWERLYIRVDVVNEVDA